MISSNGFNEGILVRILIFTHRSDIDGMGGVVLAKLAFDEVDYVLCESLNLQDRMREYFDSGAIYKYDRVFVTDMWLEEPMLSRVADDARLNNKFLLFDHHESALERGFNKYSFTTIRISDKKGLCSGTSLFHEYLVKNGLIDAGAQAISEFVELTRRHDTWEWKTKYHDELPHRLALLFDSVGCENYIQLIVKKVGDSSSVHFEFDESEKMMIDNRLRLVQEKVSEYSKKLIFKQMFGLKAGVVFIDYDYRNDLAEYLKQQEFDIDFVMMIALDYGLISYRCVNENANVRLIAEKMGGRGHDKAASSPISGSAMKKILDTLTDSDLRA